MCPPLASPSSPPLLGSGNAIGDAGAAALAGALGGLARLEGLYLA